MHAKHGDNSPPADTTGLYCLNCDYDLTGLSEHRCPECGESFDRELLHKIAAGEPLPATPYEIEHTLRSFWKTWWLALSNRAKLADEFPPVHDKGNAVLYTLLCFYIAALMNVVAFVYMIFVFDGRVSPEPLIILSVAVFLWSWLFETLVAGGLALLVPPRRVRRKFRFWRGLAHYTSGYTWLSSLWLAFSSVAIILWDDEIWMPLMLCGLIGIVIWWASAFWIMAARRGEGVFRIALAWLWVVLAGIIATIIMILFSVVIQSM